MKKLFSLSLIILLSKVGFCEPVIAKQDRYFKPVWLDLNDKRAPQLLMRNKQDYINASLAELAKRGEKIGITNAAEEFESLRLETDKLNFHHIRFKQKFKELDVFGGDLTVHFNDKHQIYMINGTYISGINISTNAIIKPKEAKKIACNKVLLTNAKIKKVRNPKLLIFGYKIKPELAYKVVIESEKYGNAPNQWHYFISAVNGKVLDFFDNIKRDPLPTNGEARVVYGNILEGEGGNFTNVVGWFPYYYGQHYLYNSYYKWVVCSNKPGYYIRCVSNNFGKTDRAAFSAALNFDTVEQYFYNVHNRRNFHNGYISSDDNKSYARAIVHEGKNYNGAYWNGKYFYFGDGDGISANAYSVLDVCGHEFTHAVTDYSANLIYQDEPGALNESFSDIFGTAVEFYAQRNESTIYPDYLPGCADWLDGEDFYLAEKAYRDLRNPSNIETVGKNRRQPTRYHGSFWYYGQADNGGVHVNSGVQNFFFYLLSEGGSGTNDGIVYNVTGINITNAEQIAYRALTVYCNGHTSYSSVRRAWIYAARDLNTNWVDNVKSAWDTVGVSDFRLLPGDEYKYVGEQGGEFYPTFTQPTLYNSGTQSLEWVVVTNQLTWLNVSLIDGRLNAGETTDLNLSLNSNVYSFLPGSYTNYFTLIDLTNGITEVREVVLKIYSPVIYSFLSDDVFPNWKCEGLWAYGLPDGGGGGPSNAFVGDSIYGYNLSGIYENNIPAYYLTTRALDFSNYENITFSFWRWLGVEQSIYDHATIEISTNGTEWFVLWNFEGKTIEDASWKNITYDISNFANRQKNVYIRWGMGPTDVGLAYCGWNIDNVSFYGNKIDKLNVTPLSEMVIHGEAGGPFSPSNLLYKIKNTGTTNLQWQVSTTSSWLNFSAVNGDILSGATESVTISLAEKTTNFVNGDYLAEITFVDSMTTETVFRNVRLFIADRLNAKFTAAPSNGAAPLAVSFQDCSTGSIKHWNWDFNNDGYVDSTNRNPQYTFFDAGAYNVKLSVDNYYTTSTVTETIIVTGEMYNVRYVSKNGTHIYPFISWETAATNIQDAVDAAFAGNTILVTDGVYFTSSAAVEGEALSNSVYLNKAITLESVNGYSNTIICGGINIFTQKIRCVYLDNVNALISGFTISNGNVSWWYGYGGGVYINNGGTVSNCVISDCYARDAGGGLYAKSDGKIIDTAIYNNRAMMEGGGIKCYGTHIKNCKITKNFSGENNVRIISSAMENCLIAENSAAYYVGGMYCENSLIVNCDIIGNVASNGCGGGIKSGNSVIRNCKIIGNNAYDCGGLVMGESKIFNSIISDNYASNNCGGIGGYTWTVNRDEYDVIQNCTISGNRAGNSSGGLDVRNCAKIRNCIVYNNIAPIFPNWSPSYCSFKNNCISPIPYGWDCNNNIDTDPKLVDSGHIAGDSDCKTAGNSAWCAGVDIDGDAWSVPGTIGCDFPTGNTPTNIMFVKINYVYDEFTVNYSNIFTASITGSSISNYWDFGDGDVETNKIFVEHSWATSGVYDVIFFAFNDLMPNGMADTVTVHVVDDNVFYVSKSSVNPQLPYNSWEIAATNIQDAVDAASLPGSIVLISNGVYYLNKQINLNKNVNIKGFENKENVIIDGNNQTRCFYISNSAVIVENITIINGYANRGGGLYSEFGGLINNCVVTGNYAAIEGGGAYFEKGGIVKNSLLAYNISKKNAGAVSFETGGKIINSSVINNRAEETGGGIYIDESSSENCEIINNFAKDRAGGVEAIYNSLIQNCLIKNNVTDGKGGGCDIQSDSMAQGCTIVSNRARTGAGVYSDHSCLLFNDIIWNNSTNSIIYNSERTVFNCCIKNYTNIINGIITNAPAFFLSDDFHLKVNSPCIDSGTNFSYVFYSCDLDNNPRIIGSVTDIGAYEFGRLHCNFIADKTIYTNSLLCNFIAIVATNNTNSLFYSWDFENDGEMDAQGEELSVASHFYANTGTFSVLLLVSNVNEKAECLKEYYIKILLPVKADFTVDKHIAEIDQLIQFTDRSEGNPNFWMWDFNNDDIIDNYDKNPSVYFNTTGYVNVKLTISNEFMSDYIIKSNIILIVERTKNHYVAPFGASVQPYTNWLIAATNIQNAVDEALSQDIVWITNGVYTSPGYCRYGTNCFVVNKNISLIGVGDKIIVDAKKLMRGAAVSSGMVENITFINGFVDGDNADGLGGGVLNENGAEISRCKFINNYAREGGGIYLSNDAVIKSSLIISNSALNGGGIALSSNVIAYNITVADNSASQRGGGTFCGDDITIINSIVYYNSATQNSNCIDIGTNVYYYYCCLPNIIHNGNHIITNNPDILSDYSLAETSYCCDAGKNYSWMYFAKDLSGKDRIQGGIVDIGAYENVPEPFFFSLIFIFFLLLVSEAQKWYNS